MIWEIAGGLAGGMSTLAVSEAVRRVMPDLVERSVFRAFAVGAGLRTLWILLLLSWILTAAPGDTRVLVPSLMLGFLASRVLEGVRYTRYFGRC